MAAVSRVPPLFGLRVEFSPGNRDKSHQRWTRLYSHRFIYFKYLPFPPCKEDSSTHAGSICRRKQLLRHCTRHMSETEGMFWGSPFNNHVIVAAATVASWFPTPTPLREARVAKVPDRELKKACRKRENPSATSLNLTGDSLISPPHLHSVPELIMQVIAADTLGVALRQKHTLKGAFEMLDLSNHARQS